MGLFNLPSPVDWVESIKDENQKRAAISLAMSIAYSQYITGLYELGTAVKSKRFIGCLGDVFVRMAASAAKLLMLQSGIKLIDLAVPAALIQDQKLLDSVWWEEKKR